MNKFFCSKINNRLEDKELKTEIFKYERYGNFFKCYSSLTKDNKIVYIHCYPLYENEDIKLRKVEKRLNKYYVI